MANPMVGGAEMFADKNIVENAVNSADHTTLMVAVTAAGLVDTLAGEGPFTVFAPTNDAFGKITEESLAALLLPENKAFLTKVLTCHVVGKAVLSDALGGMINDDGGALVPMFANLISGVSKKIGHDDVMAGNFELDGGRCMERWWVQS